MSDDYTVFRTGGVASRGPKHLEVFYCGQYGSLWHRWSNDAGASWSREECLSAGEPIVHSPAAICIVPDKLDVFYSGWMAEMHYHLWTKRCVVQNGHYVWLGDQELGNIIIYDPAVASRGPKHLEVFYCAQDGTLMHMWSNDAGASWSPGLYHEESLGGVLISSPAAICIASNQLDVFYVGQNKHLWNKRCVVQNGGYVWLGEKDLGGRIYFDA